MSDFINWLAETDWSISLHESIFAYPIIESLHVLCITVFVGMIAMLDLRLLGVAFKQVPVSQMVSRVLPPALGGFAIMVITGLLLFYAIPVRTYHSVWFRAKITLLVIGGLNAYLFHRYRKQRAAETVASDADAVPPSRLRRTGLISLVVWACVIVCGRMIAYNWFDCDRPQPGWVMWLAQCEEPEPEPEVEGP
jgi:uncharacterized membrane protein SirB2